VPRFVLVILDGAGVGALPDAADYGDAGSDTLGNLSRVVELRLPFLEKLGLGNILPMRGVPPARRPLSLPGRLLPLSSGKDTTVGHWEHMGIVTPRPFPTYPEGFPDEILLPFRERIGRDILGNKPASGTAIIAELGERHVASGEPIVYTSADSVFQIAAHVDVVPLEQLYGWCQEARDLLRGEHAVARVIARPFAGPAGSFARTKDRRDFSLPPPGPTYLDLLSQEAVPVLALGKVSDIFADRGVTATFKVASNAENLAAILDLLRGSSGDIDFSEGLLFTNLVDFDTIWGHRNDVDGFAQGLEAVDRALPAIVDALAPEDRLIISADHGVDPTTPSTDHSREYVPLLLHPAPAEAPAAVYEGGFADIGATIYEYLTGRRATLAGRSVLRLLPERGWRRCTPARPSPTGAGPGLPGRVGREEAEEAARWLGTRLGTAPQAAVLLGSGLDLPDMQAIGLPVAYAEVPHWRTGSVFGHTHNLVAGDWRGCPLVLLRGRVHGYEGFDVSERELPVRTLAAWGVRHVVFVSAAGAVTPGLEVGGIVVAREIMDLQNPLPGGAPTRFPAAARGFLFNLLHGTVGHPAWVVGVHAAVPGPQYETPTEVVALREMGATTVSMSGAVEIRAAREQAIETAMVCVVTNVGDTCHEQVLRSTAAASQTLATAVATILSAWELPARPGGAGAADPA
jgi:phosphopentomutase